MKKKGGRGSDVNCHYCNKKIEGKGKKIGPDMMYCGVECYVQEAYEDYPGTALAKMLERMYPELTREGELH